MSSRDRLEGIDPALIEAAQEKLDELCEEQGLKSFQITQKKAPWKELVLRMVGVPALEPKKRGRPSHTDNEIEEIGRTVEILQEFENLDEPGKKTLQKQNYAFAAKSKGIEERKYDSGRSSNPIEIVRGMYNRYKEQGFQKRLKEKIEKEREEWDEPDYP